MQQIEGLKYDVSETSNIEWTALTIEGDEAQIKVVTEVCKLTFIR
jgi:hypothetical protein